MVRKVRLASDDSFSPHDADSRRPAFDDLDDLVFDGPQDKSLRRPRDESGHRRRKPRHPDNDPNAARRHLADADWMSDAAQ